MCKELYMYCFTATILDVVCAGSQFLAFIKFQFILYWFQASFVLRVLQINRNPYVQLVSTVLKALTYHSRVLLGRGVTEKDSMIRRSATNAVVSIILRCEQKFFSNVYYGNCNTFEKVNNSCVVGLSEN